MKKATVKCKLERCIAVVTVALTMIVSAGCVAPAPDNPSENRIMHHVALTPADVDESIRFYRDGIGLKVLSDADIPGNWSGVFNARSDQLKSVYLGDPDRPESGVIELMVFQDGHDERPEKTAPAVGFFLISFIVDMDETLERLKALGFAQDAIRKSPMAPIPTEMILVKDPDGVWVELIPFLFYEKGANQDV